MDETPVIDLEKGCNRPISPVENVRIHGYGTSLALVGISSGVGALFVHGFRDRTLVPPEVAPWDLAWFIAYLVGGLLVLWGLIRDGNVALKLGPLCVIGKEFEIWGLFFLVGATASHAVALWAVAGYSFASLAVSGYLLGTVNRLFSLLEPAKLHVLLPIPRRR